MLTSDLALRPRIRLAGQLAAEHSVSSAFLDALADLLVVPGADEALHFHWIVIGRPAHPQISAQDAFQGNLLQPAYYWDFTVANYNLFMFAWQRDMVPFVRMRAMLEMHQNGVAATAEAINFGDGDYRLTKISENPLYRNLLA